MAARLHNELNTLDKLVTTAQAQLGKAQRSQDGDFYQAAALSKTTTWGQSGALLSYPKRHTLVSPPADYRLGPKDQLILIARKCPEIVDYSS